MNVRRGVDASSVEPRRAAFLFADQMDEACASWWLELYGRGIARHQCIETLLLILPIFSQQPYRDEALHRFVPFSTSSYCAQPELPLVVPTTRWRAALI